MFPVVQVILVLAMSTQIINITCVCNFLFSPNDVNDVLDSSFPGGQIDIFKGWLQIELVVFSGGILANMIFLLIRSFVPQKLVLRIENLMHSASTDYLESQQVLLGMFVTFFVPAFYLTYIKEYMAVTGHTDDSI